MNEDRSRSAELFWSCPGFTGSIQANDFVIRCQQYDPMRIHFRNHYAVFRCQGQAMGHIEHNAGMGSGQP